MSVRECQKVCSTPFDKLTLSGHKYRKFKRHFPPPAGVLLRHRLQDTAGEVMGTARMHPHAPAKAATAESRVGARGVSTHQAATRPRCIAIARRRCGRGVFASPIERVCRTGHARGPWDSVPSPPARAAEVAWNAAVVWHCRAAWRASGGGWGRRVSVRGPVLAWVQRARTGHTAQAPGQMAVAISAWPPCWLSWVGVHRRLRCP